MDNIQSLASFCLRPSRVLNKFTGESILAPCGSCSACQMNKRAVRVSSLMAYSAAHPNCLFVTLTYADECIPRLTCSSVDLDGIRRPGVVSGSTSSLLLFDYESLLLSRLSFLERVSSSPSNHVERAICPYISSSVIASYRSLLDSYSLEADSMYSFFLQVDPRFFELSKCMSYVSSRCSLKSSIPFAYVADLQNFLKRLRKKILKKYGKKITYYAVSEYGPRSLRPHWHIMLFFDGIEFSPFLSEAVRSCWLYGSCDSQLARTTGAAASYVASYINSYCALPQLYLHCQALRPRCLHSCGISSSHFFPRSSSVEESESLISLCLDGVGLRNSNGVVALSPPSSYIRRVFPRFRGIVGNDSSQLYDLYTAAVSLFRCYLKESALSLSDLKVSSFVEYFISLLKKYNNTSSMPSCSSLRHIAESLRLRNLHFSESLDSGGLLYYRFYRFFSQILVFLKFWRIDSSRSLRLAVDAVLSYHSRRMSLLLSSQYELLSSFDADSVNSYYSLCGYVDYVNHHACTLRSYNDSRVSSCIKHKELNDVMLSSLC